MTDKVKIFMKKEIKTYIPFIIYSIFIMGIVRVLGLIPPVILGKIIDVYIPKQNFKYIITSVIILVSIPLIVAMIDSLYRYQNGKSAKKSSFALKRKMFLNIMRQPLEFFSKNSSGSLATYAGREIVEFIAFWQLDIPTVIVNTIMILTYLLIIYSISPVIAIIQLISIPIYVYPIQFFGKKLRNNTSKLMECSSKLNEILTESFKAIPFVKSARIEEERVKKAERVNDESIKIWGKTLVFESICANWSQGLVSSIFYGVTFVIGALGVMDNTITLGKLITLTAYLPLFQSTIMSTSSTIMAAHKSLGTHEKSFEYLAMPDEDEQFTNINDKELKEEYKDIPIVFENVSFSYPGTSKVILEDFNCIAKPGEFVGIIGPSGNGKTTIFNLLLRFYNLDKGKIYIWGNEIRSKLVKDIRKEIAYVSQEPILFSGTIRENLMAVSPNVNDEEINEALRKANLLSLINNLPKGLDTQIGENGFNLSGGEKQRLAIARALLTNCRIMLLDEVVSNLDSEAEQEIEQTINNLIKEKNITILLISHKISILNNASQIIKVEKELIEG